MKRTATLFSALALALAASQAAQAASADAEAGRTAALTLCTNCHLVAPDQKFHPILAPPPPSFAEIAARQSTSAEALAGFLKGKHATGLAAHENREIVAYIMSLRK